MCYADIHQNKRCRLTISISAAFLLSTSALTAVAQSEPAQLAQDFGDMSIEELANIEITSVTKTPEPLNRAAAALYVITSEDIRRSGAKSIPEILRLAPNLQVARVNTRKYSITARGFGVDDPNKLLVLIDGRSVYSTLHAAVFWDQQDVLPENIERIEVISGPGGTTWGTNAVNGVINIITKNTKDTQGALLTAGTGTFNRDVAAQFGGEFDEQASYRVYVKAFDRLSVANGTGISLRDGEGGLQGGFRFDRSGDIDTITLQGDFHKNKIKSADAELTGENVLMRWSRTLNENSSFTVQAYYDHTKIVIPNNIGDRTSTYDIEAQHIFNWGRHQVIWGGGYRSVDGTFTNTNDVFVLPASRTLDWSNVFAQDVIDLGNDLELTLGLKYEHSSYSGGEVLPSARLSWTANDDIFLWAALSKAVRTPARVDRDYNVNVGVIPLLRGNTDFRSEELIAYELGVRVQPVPQLSVSVAGFYNEYDKLRVFQLSPNGGFPLIITNGLKGDIYGVEVWGQYAVTEWWRLHAGATIMEKNLNTEDLGPGFFAGPGIVGNDPAHQFLLRSHMNITDELELDLDFRAIAKRPDPLVPAYEELGAQLRWQVTDYLELSLAGSNLLHRRHAEFGEPPTRSEIERSVYAGMRWSY